MTDLNVTASLHGLVEPVAWHGEDVPVRRWVVPDLLPEGNVTLLAGDGGVGKSQLALQLLAATCLDRPWLGSPVRRCKAIGVFCEDDAEELHRRLADVLASYDATFGDLEDLKLVARVGLDNLLMEWPNQWEPGEITPLCSQIHNLAVEHGAELVVLDSLHDFFGGNENSRPHARQFVGALRKIAVETKGAVLLTAHPSLAGRNTGTGEAGSTAWNNAVRSRLYLTARQHDDGETDRDFRELKVMKSNYSAPGGVIRLRWRGGVFVRDDVAQAPAGIVDMIALDNAVLAVAASLIKDGVKLLANKNAPNSLANRVRQDARCNAYKWATVAAAQERMIEHGRLVRVELGPQSRRMIYIRPTDMRYPGEVGFNRGSTGDSTGVQPVASTPLQPPFNPPSRTSPHTPLVSEGGDGDTVPPSLDAILQGDRAVAGDEDRWVDHVIPSFLDKRRR